MDVDDRVNKAMKAPRPTYIQARPHELGRFLRQSLQKYRGKMSPKRVAVYACALPSFGLVNINSQLSLSSKTLTM
jgi:hypothetical protein